MLEQVEMTTLQVVAKLKCNQLSSADHRICNFPPFQRHQDAPRAQFLARRGDRGGFKSGMSPTVSQLGLLIPGMQDRGHSLHMDTPGRWICLLFFLPKTLSLAALKAQAVVEFVLALTKRTSF